MNLLMSLGTTVAYFASIVLIGLRCNTETHDPSWIARHILILLCFVILF